MGAERSNISDERNGLTHRIAEKCEKNKARQGGQAERFAQLCAMAAALRDGSTQDQDNLSEPSSSEDDSYPDYIPIVDPEAAAAARRCPRQPFTSFRS